MAACRVSRQGLAASREAGHVQGYTEHEQSMSSQSMNMLSINPFQGPTHLRREPSPATRSQICLPSTLIHMLSSNDSLT